MDSDRNAPATKGDVQDLRAEVKAMEDRLVEAFRDGQTELLKAFYNYAQSNDERVASTEAESASLKKRLAIAESRITDIERRLNWPPPTQTH
jgi:peptidoglycan hydrolase CwlO-like protein